MYLFLQMEIKTRRILVEGDHTEEVTAALLHYLSDMKSKIMEMETETETEKLKTYQMILNLIMEIPIDKKYMITDLKLFQEEIIQIMPQINKTIILITGVIMGMIT